MRHYYRDIRLLELIDLAHPLNKCIKVSLNDIRRYLAHHDRTGVIRSISDKADPVAGFLDDDIILCERGALIIICIVKVSAEDRDVRIALERSDLICGQRSVRICRIFFHTPVEFVISESDRVITHNVQRRAHDRTVRQV